MHSRIDWGTGEHRTELGRDGRADGHVHGSVFAAGLDYRFQMPTPGSIVTSVERAGVGDIAA